MDSVVTVRGAVRRQEDLFLGTTQRFMVKRKNLTLNRPEEKLLEVPLRPGWKAGTKVTFEGEGDEYEPGYCQDLVFLLVESQHRRFTRAGSDLVHHSCIPLVDALTGFKVDVPTLDNRILRVSVKELVHPTFTKVLKGEGMPDSKLPGTRGDMVLTFDIIWPKNLVRSIDEAAKSSLGVTLRARWV
jgi:DnaJ family protein B protein 4